MNKASLLIFLVCELLFPIKVQAVPSPDLVVGIGTTLVQGVSIGLIFVLSAFGAMHKFLRMIFIQSKTRFFIFSFSAFSVLIAAVIISVVCYQGYQERNLVAELRQHDISMGSMGFQNDIFSSREDEGKKNENESLDEKGSVSNSERIHLISNPAISNEELKILLAGGHINDVFMLDAREDIEYENGRFPQSVHIRMADLKAGKWADLDTQKTVIVLCWSGIRGKEVVEFLRSKGIDARYLEDGVQNWVDQGGLWDGNVSIKKTYSETQYSRLLSCSEMHEAIDTGTFVVDSREPERYSKFHIPESVSIPILSTPSSELENTLNQVPRGASVVAVCDGYVNCFDARVTGIELEKRGFTFLGRFTDLKCFR